ncbi:hypothetical protein [Streptomyces albus]|uniref:hypothetical protein n=1 Tax=Streptomyces albus TaxID=1888 RepID=UPI003403E371
MSGCGGTVRAVRQAAAVLVGLLLSLFGIAQCATAATPGTPARAAAAPPHTVAGQHTAGDDQGGDRYGAGHHVSAGAALGPHTAVVSDDSGSSRCHKSKGEGGALPAAPSAGQQQWLPLALPVCAVPESHAAIGAAHERPPVRGPAPAPSPGPVELSVLRV